MNLLAQVELSGTGSSRLRYRVGGRETAGGPDRCLKDPDSCGVGKAAGKVAFGSIVPPSNSLRATAARRSAVVPAHLGLRRPI